MVGVRLRPLTRMIVMRRTRTPMMMAMIYITLLKSTAHLAGRREKQGCTTTLAKVWEELDPEIFDDPVQSATLSPKNPKECKGTQH